MKPADPAANVSLPDTPTNPAGSLQQFMDDDTFHGKLIEFNSNPKLITKRYLHPAPAEVKPGKKPADPAANVSLPDTPTNPAGSSTARNGFPTPDTAALTFPTATTAAVAAAAADVVAAIFLQIKQAVACLTHPQTQSSAQT